MRSIRSTCLQVRNSQFRVQMASVLHAGHQMADSLLHSIRSDTKFSCLMRQDSSGEKWPMA